MKLRKNTQQIFRQISISRFKKIALAKMTNPDMF